MPHLAIKMMPGRPDELKQQLADEIVATVVRVLGTEADKVSIAIEDVPGREWMDRVFEPEIRGYKDKLFKKPGYKEV